MTKRTKKFILSVYEYCLGIVLRGKKEGILSLEEYLYKQCLTESGEFIFNRKVDKFLYWIMRFIVDDGYTSKTNQNLLKSFSKGARRRTKIALNIASLCIDGMMSEHNLDLIFIDVCSYLGVNKYQKLWDIKLKQERKFSTDKTNLVLTDAQKKRIEEVNVFFKMKEEECRSVLEREHKKLCELHKKVPEFEKNLTCTRLIYKTDKKEINFYTIYMPEVNNDPATSLYIGDELVCAAMYQFWKNYKICDYRIEIFMDITEDIPNKLAKSLEIESELQLTFSE